MSENQILNKCKTCKHLKSGQRELNYGDNTGFCVNDKLSFNTTIGRLKEFLTKKIKKIFPK